MPIICSRKDVKKNPKAQHFLFVQQNRLLGTRLPDCLSAKCKVNIRLDISEGLSIVTFKQTSEFRTNFVISSLPSGRKRYVVLRFARRALYPK